MASDPSRLLPALALSVWACGFVGLLLCWFTRWFRVRALVRDGVSLGIETGIEVRSCRTLVEPGVFGIIWPVLLLPDGIMSRLTPSQMKAILAHELCHVRRCDNLTTMLHMAVEAIFWLHPVVWWIGAQLIAERERACDEEVLRQGSDPEVYARGILNVCRFYLESPLVCFAGITGANLKKRIEYIASCRIGCRLDLGKKVLLGSAAVLAVAGPIVVGLIDAPRTFAQSTSDAAAAFEVASVKPNKSGLRGASFSLPGEGRFTARNASLKTLIGEAYRVQKFQISGPGWLDSETFDIQAKADGNPKYDDMRAMLQALLLDRFHLQTHRATRTLPLYQLVIAKGGPKIRRADDNCPAISAGTHPCGGFNIRRGGLLIGYKVSIAQTTHALAFIVGRTVTDKTGLVGMYDIDLRWSADELGQEPGVSAPQPDSSGPSLFAALEEQLGLKLQAQKGPVEFIVVDHADKVPVEN